jgi:nucleoside-diphosphate-sugar epimerase
MISDYAFPLNIGSSEMISINNLYKTIIDVNNLPYEKFKFVHNLKAPQGVRGRSSNNEECKKVLDWEPSVRISEGIKKTFDWISSELNN